LFFFAVERHRMNWRSCYCSLHMMRLRTVHVYLMYAIWKQFVSWQLFVTYSFHLTGLFSSYCRLGYVSWKRTFGDNWSKRFTCWILFLSPNQQCQSTECRDVTEFESECCHIPTIFFQIWRLIYFQTYSDSDSAFVLESWSSSFIAIHC